jgi:hypothetical protein
LRLSEAKPRQDLKEQFRRHFQRMAACRHIRQHLLNVADAAHAAGARDDEVPRNAELCGLLNLDSNDVRQIVFCRNGRDLIGAADHALGIDEPYGHGLYVGRRAHHGEAADPVNHDRQRLLDDNMVGHGLGT